MGVEMPGELLRDAGNANVPCDVARQFARGHAEIAERARDQPSVMVAGQQKRRAACLVKFLHRWNIFRAEE